MIRHFDQYIRAQLQNPHQKFEAVYSKDGVLEGVREVGKLRQLMYATVKKSASDRISRELAGALKYLRDESNIVRAQGEPTGWGKLGHERLTFNVRKEGTNEEVSARTRIGLLTDDHRELSDAQLERLHKIECSILLVERLASGELLDDTVSVVSSGSDIADAVANGNADRLFRMRTTAEREFSKDEATKPDRRANRVSYNDRLVVDAHLKLQPKKIAFVDATFADVDTNPYALIPQKNYRSMQAETFYNPEGSDGVAYATVQAQVERIPEEGEEDDDIGKTATTVAAEVERIPEEGEEYGDIDQATVRRKNQAAINSIIEAEMARARHEKEERAKLKRLKPAPLPKPKTIAVSSETATYAQVSPKDGRPPLPARTADADVLVGPVRDDIERYDSGDEVEYQEVTRPRRRELPGTTTDSSTI